MFSNTAATVADVGVDSEEDKFKGCVIYLNI
jgi:hypothetical protein